MMLRFWAVILAGLLTVYSLTVHALTTVAELPGAELVAPPPELGAKAWILIDARSGTILAEHEAQRRLPQASLTKLMTVYVVFRAIKAGKLSLDATTTVSDKAWRTGGSRIYLNKGDQPSIETLVRGLLANSGNDAAVALAEHLGGSVEGFAELMNQTAAELGMHDSHFVTPHGLHHPQHYTTAHDYALLARALVMEFPQYYHFFGLKNFTYGKVTQRNRNRLLFKPETHVDGMKTGFTVPAGYCVVNSAEQDGMRLISVILGAKNPQVRFDYSQQLFEYGFKQFRLQALTVANKPLLDVRVWGATAHNLSLGLLNPPVLLLPREYRVPLRLEYQAQEFELHGEMVRGQAYGQVRAYLERKLVYQGSLYALQPLQEAGFFARAADAAQRLWEEWWN